MALQAEALLRLQRHDEADAVFNGPSAPRFGIDESTKFFGTIGHAYVLIVRAQVDMAAGRLVPAPCKRVRMHAHAQQNAVPQMGTTQQKQRV